MHRIDLKKNTCKDPKREHLWITSNKIYTQLFNSPLVFYLLCAFSNCIILLIYEDKKVHSLCLKYIAQISLVVVSGDLGGYRNVQIINKLSS